VTRAEESGPEEILTAEVAASLCLATDLAMGFPWEHGLRATLIAMRLCDLLEVDDETAHQTYYGAMLCYAGCTVDADLGARIFGGSRTETFVPGLFGSRGEQMRGIVGALPPSDATPLTKVFEIARRLPRAVAENPNHQRSLCEVAERLAERLGLPPEMSGLFQYLAERWDGKGIVKRIAAEDIPLPTRIGMLARDAAFQYHIGGEEHARTTVAARGGHAFDPNIARRFADNTRSVLAAADVEGSAWEAVLAAEPQIWLTLDSDGLDSALSAIGAFADLISPYFAGHAEGLARLAITAGKTFGLEDDDILTLKRAALVHDVGRVGVEPRTWTVPGRLSPDQMEQVRLHPYHTERVLSMSPSLAELGTLASRHHEHMDGSGYHRGVGGAALGNLERILGAADRFNAMTEPRPHRPAITSSEAARRLADLAGEGKLAPNAVAAIIEAAGETTPQLRRPAGLTDRETEVLGLLARGLQTKQIATALGISPKTADTHIQGAYRKADVSTRAAATLFAMEHGLVHSGELPLPHATHD
jgi:HD-GYP domain-containing protein (c-di-GMP phosphodiesterase class II)